MIVVGFGLVGDKVGLDLYIDGVGGFCIYGCDCMVC